MEAQRGCELSMTSPALLPITAYIVLAASLMFGGGARRDLPSDFIPEILAIPLLALAAPGAFRILFEDRLATWILTGIVGLALLHATPLPPALWSLLPGRDVALASYHAAGMELPWLPISLHPAMAVKGAFALLPGVAIFFAIILMTQKQRFILVFIALAIGLASVPLGILQLMGGQQSPLYFYAVTNQGHAVGLFANRNHFAALLYILIPLAAAVFSEREERRGLPIWGAIIIVWLVCLVGLATTGSRSALVLGAASIVASFWLIVKPSFPEFFSGKKSKVALLVLAVLILLLVSAMGGARILGRLQNDPVDEARLSIFGTTFDLAWRFFPLGSGLGSFERLYEMSAPSDALFTEIVNHAHNDWAEAFMETGPIGVIIGLAFLYWLFGRLIAVYRGAQTTERRFALGATLVALLLCIHSLWDYPLRTLALSCCFAMSCGFLFKAPVGEENLSSHSKRKRRRTRTRRLEDAQKA